MIQVAGAALVILALIGGSFWLLKGSKKKYLPIAFIVVVILFYVSTHFLMISHPIYNKSVESLSRHSAVIDIIGTPIEASTFVGGSAGDDHAKFTYSVSGPNGKGDVYVEARKVGLRWEYVKFEFGVGVNIIDLL